MALFGVGTVILIPVVVCISFLTYWFAKFLRIWYLIGKFQGPPAIPIFGNILQLKSDSSEAFLQTQKLLNEYREKTGGVIRFWFGPFPSLAIYSAKHSEVILSGSRHIAKGFMYKFLEPWLGKGLLTSGGKKWFHRRKLLTPTFHFSILHQFMDVFNEQSFIFVDKLEKFADKPEPVNIFPLVAYCVLDIICESAMGRRTNAQGESENEYVKAVSRMGELVVRRMRMPYLWPESVFYNIGDGKAHQQALKILHDVTKKMINERLAENPISPDDTRQGGDDEVAGKRKRIAFLDLLLQMHREDPSFTLQDIREEVDTFMFEGHDTTAAATTWAILLLGLHPGVQARVHEELDQVFGTSDRPVTSDDFSRLTYLACVVKEALRMIPSVPAITRKLESDIIVDGKVVPKETIIIVNISAIHRDPEQFTDPDKFDPDRFLPENSAKRHPYAFIPFSAGPRNCIGQKFALMEDKVILANLLRRFSVESLQTFEEAKPSTQLVVRPKEGSVLVKLSRRK